ncbi:MAG TPA: hypothetical protein VFN61_01960 [Acidimicrobiales bacterium]|nr:hypothetical protein [Acidimicrobiales bacterium]
MGLLLVALVVGTAIWVNVDAKVMRDDDGRVGGYTRVAWTWGVLLLWVVCFPCYLWERHKMPKPWERR